MTVDWRRQDPHGLLVALRDGQPDRAAGPIRRRLRQRHRRRPPRHRHAARRAAQPEPLPGRRDPTTSSRTGPAGRRTRRSARRWSAASMIDRVARRPRPPAARGAGRLQVVRARPARRHPRLRRRGERRRLLPAPRRQRLDDRQGRPHPRACWPPRSPRSPARSPAQLYRELTGRYGAPGLRAHRRPGDPGSRRPRWRSSRPTRSTADRARRRADHRDAHQAPPATAPPSAASRSPPRPAGSPPGPRAPRTSTRSTPSPSKARNTWPRFRRRPGPSSTERSSYCSPRDPCPWRPYHHRGLNCNICIRMTIMTRSRSNSRLDECAHSSGETG